ncbi:hypothetical protein PV04_10308 [Phialophora macrospora]|uniref:Uncharacterized protein n=1 Tax=Phialophora macrospora TaxID=1851006 RepID=A0A0D2DM96_9EURO|nr:hypothetical protein PV04_10308 [Phialophora macrospora]
MWLAEVVWRGRLYRVGSSPRHPPTQSSSWLRSRPPALHTTETNRNTSTSPSHSHLVSGGLPKRTTALLGVQPSSASPSPTRSHTGRPSAVSAATVIRFPRRLAAILSVIPISATTLAQASTPTYRPSQPAV